MATKKNTRRPAPATPSAPDIAPAARPAPSAGPAPGGATAAIQGALAANPGATIAVPWTVSGPGHGVAGRSRRQAAQASHRHQGQIWPARTPGSSARTAHPAASAARPVPQHGQVGRLIWILFPRKSKILRLPSCVR